MIRRRRTSALYFTRSEELVTVHALWQRVATTLR